MKSRIVQYNIVKLDLGSGASRRGSSSLLIRTISLSRSFRDIQEKIFKLFTDEGIKEYEELQRELEE